MDAHILLSRIKAYGVDTEAILKRFMGDEELYSSCLTAFLHHKDFKTLAQAISCSDVQCAFNAAHNLKGVSGNLGLTPLYEAVSKLVETLRANDMSNSDADYRAVRIQYMSLLSIVGNPHD